MSMRWSAYSSAKAFWMPDRGPSYECDTGYVPELPERFLIPMPIIAVWIADVAAGRWTWTRNTRCKYVTLFLDTRAGAYSVKDRDGHPITADILLFQEGIYDAP